MGSDEPVCPVCGQRVETVVRRHKTLGAWVPVWVPGPCRNAGCPAFAEPSTARASRSEPPVVAAPNEDGDASGAAGTSGTSEASAADEP
ncbi:hypothetical protein [Streptomyces sp. NPDC014006]|uniref:hypothetical protein n=1 Tax=Streptomyces sp. NPDC014006 TaxID=3364870 RepID=UPI0036F6FC21